MKTAIPVRPCAVRAGGYVPSCGERSDDRGGAGVAGRPRQRARARGTAALLAAIAALAPASGLGAGAPAEHRALLQRWPDTLQRRLPGGLVLWQWLALPGLVLAAWGAGWLLSRLSRRLLSRLTRRTTMQWDDAIVARLGGPLTLAWTLIVLHLALPWLELAAPAQEFAHRVTRAGLFVDFFWVLARALDVAAQVVGSSRWAQEHPASRSLVPLGARLGKLAVLSIAVVALVSAVGYPVGSLLAGLGIGGLAVALAGQKTIENLFGAFSIGADQPFRQGDVVRIDDVIGTVEAIGLRSTKIRSLDRTLISIPNGKLAEMRLESFSARDRLRLACTLGLVHGTTAAQLRQVLAGLEAALREHPKLWPEGVVVRLKELGESALCVEVMAWFATVDFAEFQLIRQELLLRFLEIVQEAGSALAFPTRTLHLVQPRA